MAGAGKAAILMLRVDAYMWHMQDSLQPTAQLLESVIGSEHHVVKVMQDLAEANLSAATRSAREQQRRIQEAELASRCAAACSDRQDVTPKALASFNELALTCHKAWAGCLFLGGWCAT